MGVRWVSWRARIPIFSVWTSWLTWFHLSILLCQHPLIFSEANFSEAFVLLQNVCGCCSWWGSWDGWCLRRLDQCGLWSACGAEEFIPESWGVVLGGAVCSICEGVLVRGDCEALTWELSRFPAWPSLGWWVMASWTPPDEPGLGFMPYNPPMQFSVLLAVEQITYPFLQPWLWDTQNLICVKGLCREGEQLERVRHYLLILRTSASQHSSSNDLNRSPFTCLYPGASLSH